jgi:hypothetical protein
VVGGFRDAEAPLAFLSEDTARALPGPGCSTSGQGARRTETRGGAGHGAVMFGSPRTARSRSQRGSAHPSS